MDGYFKERDLAIVGYYRTLQEVNVGYRRLLLEGLDENKVYHVNDLDLYGDELMNVGLLISDGSSGEKRMVLEIIILNYIF